MRMEEIFELFEQGAARLEQYRSEVAEIERKMAPHKEALNRLHVQMDRIEDRLANDLDELLPNWRDIVTGRAARNEGK